VAALKARAVQMRAPLLLIFDRRTQVPLVLPKRLWSIRRDNDLGKSRPPSKRLSVPRLAPRVAGRDQVALDDVAALATDIEAVFADAVDRREIVCPQRRSGRIGRAVVPASDSHVTSGWAYLSCLRTC
jgi:hypothetical protein